MANLAILIGNTDYRAMTKLECCQADVHAIHELLKATEKFDEVSAFTRKFRDAALRKTEGPVFYTDIMSTLRDSFIDNDSQTPHFVSQGTGREQFIDDAKRLEHLRASLEEARTADVAQTQAEQLAEPPPPSLLERLQAADTKIVTTKLMSLFVGSFFDNLIKKLSGGDFGDFYSHDVIEHSRFEEETAEKSIIGVLQKEKRADNFVTAHYSRKLRNPNPLLGGVLHGYFDDDAYVETWDLRLNCTMERAQLKITLTPKFNNLQRLVLVVTCAPSLDRCYIFEITTQHMLQDFGKFDTGGRQLSNRWWNRAWTESTDAIVQQIAAKFDEATRKQLDDAETRLSKASASAPHNPKP